MRLMSKGEYVIVPKGTKFMGAGKLGLTVISKWDTQDQELAFLLLYIGNCFLISFSFSWNVKATVSLLFFETPVYRLLSSVYQILWNFDVTIHYLLYFQL